MTAGRSQGTFYCREDFDILSLNVTFSLQADFTQNRVFPSVYSICAVLVLPLQ